MRAPTCKVKNYAGDVLEIPMSETAFLSALSKLRQGRTFKQAFRGLRVAELEKVFAHLMTPKGT